MIRFTIPALLLMLPAQDVRCYSIWHYNYPQHCGVYRAQAIVSPNPPPRPLYLEVPGDSDIDIPLPSLEGMAFPPDCDLEWCQRLKGIGMLRDKLGTN